MPEDDGYQEAESKPTPTPPPVMGPVSAGQRLSGPPPTLDSTPEGTKAKAGKAGFGLLLATLAAKAKLVFGLLKPLLILAKGGKILTTAGTMLLSVWFYSLAFGWPFAFGFVILILIHEMGHVYVAWRQGVPVSAPLFIPGFGALILQKRTAKSAWGEALIGIGGPAAGTLGALACWAVFLVTHNHFFLALAYVGFLINLFNLTPMFPLDGGWIVAAVSPYLWLVGFALMTFLFVGGFVRNPFILILALVSAPTIWRGLSKKGEYFPGLLPATAQQRMTMGACYVGLVGFLFWAMAFTHVTPRR